MTPSRRQFLKQTGCGISAAAVLASVEQFGLINAFAQQPEVASDYKALVCIFLYGGNDGNNMVVPLDAEYNAYAAVRGVPPNGAGLGLPQSVLLPINPPGDRQFGLHPNLSPEIANPLTNGQPTKKGLLDVWNQGKLAILCNVGTLVQPITRDQYLANVGHPYQLFSHSDQQTEFQTSSASTVGQTGWGGRIADVTFALNGSTPVPMNVSVAGTALFATGSSSRQLSISPYANLNQALQLNMQGGSSADQSARLAAFQQLLGYDRDSIPISAADDTTNQALVASAALSSANVQPTIVFPTTALGYQLQQVARLIKVKDALGMKRQIFFCSLGGFDTHNNQTGTAPTSLSNAGSGGSGNQGSLLAQLSQAMRAFYDEMGVQAISDRVTTFTLSDFGRTLAASGSGATAVGSDHAWGNHALIMGGSVVGQSFYGTYPVLQLSGPNDADSRGRWIPTTSVEQYAATLGAWYGVAPSDLATVFPLLSRFSPSNLGFLG
jgi:uncharacterized protein (DUF1501 family)